MSVDFDATVVGAGAVGLACGRALSKRGLSVLVLEREAHIGQGVSSRNSEVIHGGLYYPTGSLKARFCVEGRRALYAFLDSHKVDYRKCGKLVVATDEAEVARVEAIYEQGVTNGVEGLDHLTGAQARALEPALNAHAAILSAESGVFDSHGYMLALQGEIEDAGGSVVVTTPFERAEALPGGGFKVMAGGKGGATLTTRLLVTAPGLQAQGVAGLIEGYPADSIPAGHFGKGVYFRLSGRAPFERLIYPPPIPGALGTHYRRDLGGQAVFGPDLAYVASEDYSVDPAKRDEFVSYIRRFWPGVEAERLTPDYAGIRPKLHGPGEAQPDFRLDGADVHGIEGLVALFGIESPGLTSSLAIGEAAAGGCTMDDVTFRPAVAVDVPLIQPLVHHAYRGDRARVGWTHEADLLDAARIDEKALAESVGDAAQVILLAERDGDLVGCVHVSDRGGGLAYLGMLTVDATLQSRGLGRRLIEQAEDIARDRFGADRMEMTVIVQRAELIEWYQRRGYRLTGETRPFPTTDPRFGVPRRSDLAFVVMERALV